MRFVLVDKAHFLFCAPMQAIQYDVRQFNVPRNLQIHAARGLIGIDCTDAIDGAAILF